MDFCFICDNSLTHPIKLDCDHQFCFHCLLPWFRWALMKTMFVCPLCDEEVVHLTIGDRILTPVEGRLLAWTYSFMYPSPYHEPTSLVQMMAEIDGRIAAADAGTSSSNEEGLLVEIGNAWLREEMGMDSEAGMYKLLKDFVNNNYGWLWSFNIKKCCE